MERRLFPSGVLRVEEGRFAETLLAQVGDWLAAGENRILPTGLAYSNAEVYRYVSNVARLYREKRLKRLQMEGSAQNELEGGSQP